MSVEMSIQRKTVSEGANGTLDVLVDGRWINVVPWPDHLAALEAAKMDAGLLDQLTEHHREEMDSTSPSDEYYKYHYLLYVKLQRYREQISQ